MLLLLLMLVALTALISFDAMAPSASVDFSIAFDPAADIRPATVAVAPVAYALADNRTVAVTTGCHCDSLWASVGIGRPPAGVFLMLLLSFILLLLLLLLPLLM